MTVSNVTPLVIKSEALPSYLKWFATDDTVTLIYAKKPSVSSISKDCNVSNNGFDQDTSIIEDFELTGQPLQVDLGDNTNDTVRGITQDRSAQIWPADELKHLPLSVREARRTLNNILKKGKSKIGETPLYFVLCAGGDNKKTILLGGNVDDFTGYSVHILEPRSQNKVQSSLQDMVDDHLKDCYDDKQVKYLVQMSYNIYGRNLKNIVSQKLQIKQFQVDGNISVDITASNNVFRPCKTDVVDMKMNVSVVAGHPHLKLTFLWQELMKLHRIYSFLSDSEAKIEEDTSFCEYPLEQDEILHIIAESVSLKQLYPMNKKTTVDLNDLRHLSLLDRLWNILSCCRSISILKDSFDFLFSELLEARSNIILVDMSDNISTLIKRILEGHRGGMSKNSLKQSAEFLFELGARKLKLDFQTILSQFPSSNVNVDSVWRTFSTAPQPKLRVFSKSIVEMNDQMAYLSQLYIASELFYLVKDQVNLSDDGLMQCCESIKLEYISTKNRITDFKDLIDNPLRTIDFNLNINHDSFIDSMCPSHWTLTMETGPLTTIYHLSAQPVFPPNIYCDVANPDTDLPLYYVTKMSRSCRRVY